MLFVSLFFYHTAVTCLSTFVFYTVWVSEYSYCGTSRLNKSLEFFFLLKVFKERAANLWAPRWSSLTYGVPAATGDSSTAGNPGGRHWRGLGILFDASGSPAVPSSHPDSSARLVGISLVRMPDWIRGWMTIAVPSSQVPQVVGLVFSVVSLSCPAMEKNY